MLNFKSEKFYLLMRSGRSRHITMPNFVEILQSIDIYGFVFFQNSHCCHLEFLKSQQFICWIQRVKTHQCAEFCQNRSIGCKDIKIFQFFQMAAVRHRGFVWGYIWTTHRQYLGVSITLQNLVMIDAVVLII